MGDRANIVLKQEDDKDQLIYLYTHWAGTDLALILQDALKKRWRWEDPAYLTRIIFEEMIQHSRGEETGFGIGISEPDNQHRWLYLDVPKKMVHICEQHDEGWYAWVKSGYKADYPQSSGGRLDAGKKPIHSLSFEDYCKLTPKEIELLYLGEFADEEEDLS